MKAVVIGANGQLGSDLVPIFSGSGMNVFPLNHDQVDVTDRDGLFIALSERKPDIVVNTAAMHNVEKCEEDPLGAFKVNALGSKSLAELAADLDFALVYISTDYVFSGETNRPYVESDVPAPVNSYGTSKLAGEHYVAAKTRRHFIVRVSGLYGHHPCRAKGGLNFVQLMLKLAQERDRVRVVDDEILTPTFTEDIARQLVQLASTDAYGTYHITAQGQCSWYEFAREIFALVDADVRLERAGPGEFPSKAARPRYSVLENHALRELGVDEMVSWQDGLRKYLSTLR